MMKKSNENKLFAFQVAGKKASVKTESKWQARDGVATAGCSGPDSRADHRRFGRDRGMWC